MSDITLSEDEEADSHVANANVRGKHKASRNPIRNFFEFDSTTRRSNCLTTRCGVSIKGKTQQI